MTPDFLLLSQSQVADEEVVRQALLRGQVVVVTGSDCQPSGVIDVWAQLDSPHRRLAPSPDSYVTVGPSLRLDEVLRRLGEAGARVALVTQLSASTGKQEVLGVITERDIAKAAYATARLTG